MSSGTTRTSGWAVFWFLIGFTILGTAAIGTGPIGLGAGALVLVGSAVIFKKARQQEEL